MPPFNTEMVRAILEGRKSVTRRVVKPQPLNELIVCHVAGRDKLYNYFPPYQTGDILYVRETWCQYGKLNDYDQLIEGTEEYYYRADGENPTPFNDFLVQHSGWDEHRENPVWRPSIHMPKEAARIFLRVTDVRVERLQDIDDNGVVSEGLEIGDPFDELWDSTIKKADLPIYGWAANPWVWVIAFERIDKEAALDAGL